MTGKGALLLVLGFGMILMILGRNLMSYSTEAVSNMATYAEITESHNLAVSGAEMGLAVLYADSSWRGPMEQTLPHGSFVVRVVDHGISLELLSVSTFPSMPDPLYDTVKVALSPRTDRPFTLYAWMSQFEGNFFWETGDSIWGPLHSNGRIHINGSPVFFGKVTTAKAFDPPKVGVGRNQAIFKDAYETGIAPIEFPSNISDVLSAAAVGGHRYATEIWVDLDPNGKAYIRMSSGGAIADSVDLDDPSFNGAIASNVRVNVRGTLSGRLSLGSAGDIRVTGDLRYADRTQDLLGLIAQDNVYLADVPANRDGVILDACVFANTGEFGAEGTINGPFDFFGSIVQHDRSRPFGTIRRLHYDTRLADPDFRPLWFPGYTATSYAITNWWENARVSSIK